MDPLPPITPPTPPPTPVVPPTARWGMLGGVLVGAIALGVGAYFLSGKIYDASYVVPSFTPRPSLTSSVPADWKTYTNATYGFEFRYPSDWNFSVSDGGGVLDIHATNKPDGDERVDCSVFEGLEIQVGLPRDTSKTLKAFVESEVGKYDLGPNGTIESTLISGYPAFRVQSAGWDGGCGGPGYFIEQDARRYTYVFTGKGATVSSNTLDQILSTFKFTGDQWRVYRDNARGFTMSFPAHWLTSDNDSTVKIIGSNLDIPSIVIQYFATLADIPLNPISKKPYEYFDRYVMDENFFKNQKIISFGNGSATSATPVANPSMRVILIGGNGHFYQISYQPRHQQTWTELDQILSTFRFTK